MLFISPARAAQTTGNAATPQTTRATSAQLVVVLVLLLVSRQRRVLEGYFLPRLETLDHLHAGVVGEAGDDGALLEELLPAVFVGRLAVFLHVLRRHGVRVELLLDEHQLDAVALED